jgi:flagella basal body P-ring formation protein FlgA
MALASAPISLQLTQAEEALVHPDGIRIADVAEVSGSTAVERRRLGGRVVAALPGGRGAEVISRGALTQLLHRQTGLAVTGGRDGTLRLRAAAPASQPIRLPCWAAAKPIRAGAVIGADSVEQADCAGSEGPRLMRFDAAAAAVRAIADIAAGTPLGRMSAPSMAPVERGAELTLTSAVGPVALSRPVRALQTGRSGRRMFVLDADGQVLSVPVRQSEGDGQ